MDSVLQLLALVEQAMATVASALPLGYAFGAGMVASVNPCGFLMLPAFGTYYLGLEGAGEEGRPPLLRAAQAVGLGLMATLGFVALFGTVGLVLALVGRGLAAYFPYGGLLIGLGLVGLGVWLLVTGHSVGILAASRVQPTFGGTAASVFLFGIGYGISSLACTLPVFLVVVGTALVSRGMLDALGQFVSFGLGMGLVLTLVTLGVAFFKGVVTGRLRRLFPYVHRVSAVFVLLAGLYVVYYWLVPGGLLGQ